MREFFVVFGESAKLNSSSKKFSAFFFFLHNYQNSNSIFKLKVKHNWRILRHTQNALTNSLSLKRTLIQCELPLGVFSKNVDFRTFFVCPTVISPPQHLAFYLAFQKGNAGCYPTAAGTEAIYCMYTMLYFSCNFVFVQ